MTLISHYDQVIDLSRIVHVRPVRWPSVDLEHGLYISFGADDSYRLEYSNKTNRDLDYTILTAAISEIEFKSVSFLFIFFQIE